MGRVRIELPIEYIRAVKHEAFWEKSFHRLRCSKEGHAWIADTECPQLDVCKWCKRCSFLV